MKDNTIQDIKDSISLDEKIKSLEADCQAWSEASERDKKEISSLKQQLQNQVNLCQRYFLMLESALLPTTKR